MKKIWIGVGVVVVIGIFVAVNLGREGSKTEVEVSEVIRRDIRKTVIASGRIQARRKVDVSASAIGKITRLAVKEGDVVERGQFLLQIDPTDYQSQVDQLEASIRSGEATLRMEKANLAKAEYDLERAEKLHAQEVVSDEELRTARLNADVARARVDTAQETLAQYRANLSKARHDLDEVRITADIDGVITALHVEEGENAIMGTLNNPGTVLLTISDLSEIEAEVEVDETEVVFVEVGQAAAITVDAYPDSTFRGVVTEVGNSPILTQVGLGQSSVDFKVVIVVQDRIPGVRPGLSASAEIEVGRAQDVLTIPIQCLTVRQRHQFEDMDAEAEGADEDVEGVFRVEDGQVSYRPVRVGLVGSEYVELHDGVEEGDRIVSGPFRAINQLEPGEPVTIEDKASDGE